jgi:two-component system nitrogen regulation sensor histidine kinase GlnL
VADSPALLAGLLDSLGLPIVAVTADGVVARVNDAAEAWLGRSRGRLEGRALSAVEPVGPALVEHARRAAADGVAKRVSVAFRGGTVDASVDPWWVGAQLEGAIVTVHRAAPPAAEAGGDVAALAAGLAHEVRNPLAAMRGAAELLRGEVTGGDAREYVELVLRETARVDGLVGRMMELARPPALRRTPTAVGELLHELALEAKALARGRGVACRVDEDYDPALPPLPVDRGRLFEALVNLVRNAVEALPPEGGRVRLVARLDSSRHRRGPDGRPVRLVQLVVRDDGPGLGAARDKLFTPFFTTKATGTGLGLLLVRKAVEAHGGRFELRDAANGGAGTEAEVLLPAEAIDG